MTKPYNKQAPREKLCMTLKAFLDGGLGGGTEGWHSLRKELLLLERNVTWKVGMFHFCHQLLCNAICCVKNETLWNEILFGSTIFI
jgi:hypothetical protein